MLAKASPGMLEGKRIRPRREVAREMAMKPRWHSTTRRRREDSSQAEDQPKVEARKGQRFGASSSVNWTGQELR